MPIYLRGDVWYYLFYVNGRRCRGSTKTKNKKQAERIEAKARVAAESGESLQPKRAPLIQDFAKQFLEWLDKTMLERKTKNDYKNGRRLILQSALCGMRMQTKPARKRLEVVLKRRTLAHTGPNRTAHLRHTCLG